MQSMIAILMKRFSISPKSGQQPIVWNRRRKWVYHYYPWKVFSLISPYRHPSRKISKILSRTGCRDFLFLIAARSWNCCRLLCTKASKFSTILPTTRSSILSSPACWTLRNHYHDSTLTPLFSHLPRSHFSDAYQYRGIWWWCFAKKRGDFLHPTISA